MQFLNWSEANLNQEIEFQIQERLQFSADSVQITIFLFCLNIYRFASELNMATARFTNPPRNMLNFKVAF